VFSGVMLGRDWIVGRNNRNRMRMPYYYHGGTEGNPISLRFHFV